MENKWYNIKLLRGLFYMAGSLFLFEIVGFELFIVFSLSIIMAEQNIKK
jgi:hypothetical protein